MRTFKFDTICFLGVVLSGIISCRQEIGPGPLREQRPVTLAVEGYDHIDSAQVLFFRKFPDRDSLVERKSVYDITNSIQRYDFTLPLGVYDILILGNVSPDRIIARPPFDRNRVWVDYTGEQTIPAVYLGKIQVNVGVDTLKSSGMILMTAAVELTLQQVPENVDRVDVHLLNTDSGFDGDRMLDIPVQPEISASLYDTKADRSYVLELSSFPTVEKYGQSKLVIRCYDRTGKSVYSGESASFLCQIGRRRVVSCTFRALAAKRTRKPGSGEEEHLKLIWRYDE